MCVCVCVIYVLLACRGQSVSATVCMKGTYFFSIFVTVHITFATTVCFIIIIIIIIGAYIPTPCSIVLAALWFSSG